MAKIAKTRGKYDGVQDAIHPGKGFLPEGKMRGCEGKVEIAHAAILDPDEKAPVHIRLGKRQRVMHNVGADPLEREYRYGRLGRLQYAAGLRYRRTMDDARGRGDPGPSEGRGERNAQANECLIVARLEAAQEAVEMKSEVLVLCGERGAMILERVLGDECGFRDVAHMLGGAPGAPTFWLRKAGISRVAREFREGLRLLADHWFKATR